MATQIVMRFICNICKSVAEPLTSDLTGTAKKVAPPKDWAEVVGVDKRRTLDIQLCPSCIKAIKEDNVRVTAKAKEE